MRLSVSGCGHKKSSAVHFYVCIPYKSCACCNIIALFESSPFITSLVRFHSQSVTRYSIVEFFTENVPLNLWAETCNKTD